MNNQTSKYIDFENRLRKKYRLVGKQARKQGISCFRFYDHDMPEFPICVEQYEDHIYMAEYVRKHRLDDYLYQEWRTQSIQAVANVTGIPKEKIFFKQRYKVVSRNDQYQKLDSSQHKIIGHENGLQFYLNLQDYLDSGLFLDHRLTRQHIRSIAENKKVLNLFCYTGSFSVYAVAGNAAEVVSVDMSNTYIAWTNDNLMLNNLHSNKTKSVREDVMKYIRDEKSNYYDIIILDPPTFSISKKMEDTLEIQRDHVWLINQCLRCLRPGGILYFSTNYTKFELEAQYLDSREIKDITQETTPFDFEGKLKRYCWEITKAK